MHRLCRVLKPAHKVYLDWLSHSHDNCGNCNCNCNLPLTPAIISTQPVSSIHLETNLCRSLSQHDSFRIFRKYFTCGKQPMAKNSVCQILDKTHQSYISFFLPLSHSNPAHYFLLLKGAWLNWIQFTEEVSELKSYKASFARLVV